MWAQQTPGCWGSNVLRVSGELVLRPSRDSLLQGQHSEELQEISWKRNSPKKNKTATVCLIPQKVPLTFLMGEMIYRMPVTWIHCLPSSMESIKVTNLPVSTWGLCENSQKPFGWLRPRGAGLPSWGYEVVSHRDLISVSLTTSDVEHLFNVLSCVSSFEKCLVRSFAQFFSFFIFPSVFLRY